MKAGIPRKIKELEFREPTSKIAGVEGAAQSLPCLRKGLQGVGGKVVNQTIAEAQGLQTVLAN